MLVACGKLEQDQVASCGGCQAREGVPFELYGDATLVGDVGNLIANMTSYSGPNTLRAYMTTRQAIRRSPELSL